MCYALCRTAYRLSTLLENGSKYFGHCSASSSIYYIDVYVCAPHLLLPALARRSDVSLSRWLPPARSSRPLSWVPQPNSMVSAALWCPFLQSSSVRPWAQHVTCLAWTLTRSTTARNDSICYPLCPDVAQCCPLLDPRSWIRSRIRMSTWCMKCKLWAFQCHPHGLQWPLYCRLYLHDLLECISGTEISSQKIQMILKAPNDQWHSVGLNILRTS